MGEAENLAVVAEHMAGEATDPASIMKLYTDDVLFEVPSRGIALRDVVAIEANYRRMFASIAGLTVWPLSRVASGDVVADVCLARFQLIGDGFEGAGVPIGAQVELLLRHTFVLRDGRIARETVQEDWRLE